MMMRSSFSNSVVGQQVVPVAAGDGEHPSLGGVVPRPGAAVTGSLRNVRRVLQVRRQEVLGEVVESRGLSAIGSGWWVDAHEYDLRWSGAAISAPLYSTGIPPSG